MVCMGHLVVVFAVSAWLKDGLRISFLRSFLRPVGRMACISAGDGDTNAINKQTI